MNADHIALVQTLSNDKISFSALCDKLNEAGLTDVEAMAAIRGADAEDRAAVRAATATIREMRII